MCPGCEARCSFNQCEQFDVDCILSPKGAEPTNLLYHAENGVCECLDPDRCPSGIEKCSCPKPFVREV